VWIDIRTLRHWLSNSLWDLLCRLLYEHSRLIHKHGLFHVNSYQQRRIPNLDEWPLRSFMGQHALSWHWLLQ